MLGSARQGIGPVFYLASPSHSYHLRVVRFEMLVTLLVMLTCVVVQMIDQPEVYAAQSVPNQPTAVTLTQPQVASATTTDIPTGVAVVIPAPTLPKVSLPACQPTAGLSQQAVNLGQYGDGLTIVRDGARYYQVFGDDAATLRQQIQRCGPQNEYAADSAYSLNWSYALRANDTGLCRVVGIKIGVRTSMLLPQRAITGNETASLVSSWQSFSASLMAHEIGHVTVAEQYAAQLLATLQAYPLGDCYTMSPAVEATAKAVAGQLVTAQHAYDVTTRHGASQGAIF